MYKVVAHQSAGLNSYIASPMADADYNTICEFKHKFINYTKVIEKLWNLKKLILSQASTTTIKYNI
jgi:hypothetical protein